MLAKDHVSSGRSWEETRYCCWIFTQLTAARITEGSLEKVQSQELNTRAARKYILTQEYAGVTEGDSLDEAQSN